MLVVTDMPQIREAIRDKFVSWGCSPACPAQKILSGSKNLDRRDLRICPFDAGFLVLWNEQIS